MNYQESNLVELKRTVEDDMKCEIIAFLNSYLGGTILVGVNDDGSLHKYTQKDQDINESKIIHWIRDEAIYPNCSEFVELSYNDDHVLVVNIKPGNNKPYYIKSKGPKPSGVYIRYGRNKSQASQEEITRMIRENQQITYEELISKYQNLSFKTLENKFIEKGFDFEEFKMVTSSFIDINTGSYTNLAYWFSDQYNYETKVAVYQGLDRTIFRSKKEFNGSIIKQIDQVMEYFELCNEIHIIIDGSPTRKEIPSYSMKAAREGILNCYCHKDYSRKSNIKIEFFDDRCEIISPGGFYDGLTLESALSGIQSFRNANLVKLLFKLEYIENYASGLTRIFSEYKNYDFKPKVESSLISLKLTLPNCNFNTALENKFNVPDGTLNDTLNGTLNNQQYEIFLKLYSTIEKNPGINRKTLANQLGISTRTLARYLSILIDKHYIIREGSKKTGGYRMITQDDSMTYKD